MSKVASLVCGIIFGIGLVISEMINPEKVLGFLNVFRDWDPSLALVMIGALAISTPIFHLFKNNNKPLFSSSFLIPKNNSSPIFIADRKFLMGAALMPKRYSANCFDP